jgi:hypothetical protein
MNYTTSFRWGNPELPLKVGSGYPLRRPEEKSLGSGKDHSQIGKHIRKYGNAMRPGFEFQPNIGTE